MSPSFYAHIINGLFLFIAIIFIFIRYNQLSSLDSYRLVIMLLLLSISVGIHGLSHLGLEKIYGYNPLK